jgi:outer membrane immunogenic protein
MGVLRRGVVGLTVVAGLGLAVTAASADETYTAVGAAWSYYEPASIWRGLYGGAHIGRADADGDTGFIGGVQLGYNWQSRQIVYGVEGDISLSGSSSIDWTASLRGRLGYLIQPKVLVYGTAGLGLVNGGGTDAGFAYGVGLEGKLSPTVSARLEYLAITDDNVHGDGVGVVRAGVNIKLGP